jgi:hypothetical protein
MQMLVLPRSSVNLARPKNSHETAKDSADYRKGAQALSGLQNAGSQGRKVDRPIRIDRIHSNWLAGILLKNDGL